jgi:hypothetical protein
MVELRELNPFDLRCSICKKKVENDGIYAIVNLPDNRNEYVDKRQGIVCAHHSGVVGHLVYSTKDQLVAGSMIKHSAWAFREGLSAEEALEVIRLDNKKLAKRV